MSKAAELAKWGEVSTNGQVSGRRNIIMNGAMNVAQRGTSTTGIGADATTFPTVDRFAISAFGTTAGRLTMTQTADGPSGFANCVKLDCTTADTSIAAGEGLIFLQSIEGQDLQQLKKGTSDAEKLTVSFYVKGNANATYTTELRDHDNTRYNSQEFSVTTAWNKITLTYVGDTTGAFDDDNVASLRLFIWLHAGSNFTGGTHTSNVWHTTDNQRVGDNQTSFFDSTDRTFFITGVQMEVGSVATPFEHRSYGEELALCQRYFETSYVVGTALGASSQGGKGAVFANSHTQNAYNSAGEPRWNTRKRAIPTVVIYNANTGTVNSVYNHDSGANKTISSITDINELGFGLIYHASAMGAGYRYTYHYTADSEL